MLGELVSTNSNNRSSSSNSDHCGGKNDQNNAKYSLVAGIFNNFLELKLVLDEIFC